MHWTEKYSTVPFKLYGRDQSGVDCWGLVCMVYEGELGIELPLHGAVSADTLRDTARVVQGDCDNLGLWRRVDEPAEFDVVVMAARVGSHRLGTHVGVVVGTDLVFHTEVTSGSVVVKINHPTVRQRILGFYRHQGIS